MSIEYDVCGWYTASELYEWQCSGGPRARRKTDHGTTCAIACVCWHQSFKNSGSNLHVSVGAAVVMACTLWVGHRNSERSALLDLPGPTDAPRDI
jgi:hypothetical protein